MSHGKEMQEGPYACENVEIFNKGAKALRDSFLEKTKPKIELDEEEEKKLRKLRKKSIRDLKKKLHIQRQEAKGKGIR